MVEADTIILLPSWVTAAQAAPALLSSSTPYQAKPYLRLKALHNGQCQRVLRVLIICVLLVVAVAVEKTLLLALVAVGVLAATGLDLHNRLVIQRQITY